MCKFDSLANKITFISNLESSSNDDTSPSQLCQKFFDFTDITSNSQSLFDQCPQQVSVIIKNDVSLVQLHNVVRSKAIFYFNLRAKNQREIKVLIDKIGILDPTSVESQNLIKILQAKELKLSKYADFWPEYSERVRSLLNRYVIIMSNESRGLYSVFGHEESPAIIEERLSLIHQYIEIISEMRIVKVNVTYMYDDAPICPNCDRHLLMNSELEKITCPCGFIDEEVFVSLEQTNTYENTFQKPSDKILSSFEVWLSRYLGTSSESFDEVQMFRKFDIEAMNLGWPTQSQMLSGAKSKINLKKLIVLMKATDYSTYFKIKNIIRHKYTGWELPVLTEEQKSQLRSNYVMVQLAYPEFAKRKQNINSEIMGYFHLTAVGHDCQIEDFKIPSSEKTIEDANEVGIPLFGKFGLTIRPVSN